MTGRRPPITGVIRLPDRSGKTNDVFPWNERFWLVASVAYVVLVFTIGGSARPEVASLPLLRGLAVLGIGLALAGLPRLSLTGFWPLLLMGLGMLALPLVHLVPLPPGMSASLPGRTILADIDRLTGLNGLWRPISMAPMHTANAFMAVVVPFAALMLALQAGLPNQQRLALTVTGIAAASALLGLAQILDPASSNLYLYATTNHGSAVGLFANRNHHAVFLACAMILLPFACPHACSALARRPAWNSATLHLCLILAGCLFLVTLVLLTGSRAGLLASVIALLSLPLILSAQRKALSSQPFLDRPRSIWGRSLMIALLVAAAFPLTIWLDRAAALDRLLQTIPEGEGRLQILPTVWDITTRYWPLGSGMGSFEKVYQIHEPDGLLSGTYMNHAHNDLLEVILTGGLPASILLLCGVALWLIAAFRIFVQDRRDSLQPLRKAGLIIVLILALASLTDYPLRTPALSCLFAIAAVWAAIPQRPTFIADLTRTVANRRDF